MKDLGSRALAQRIYNYLQHHNRVIQNWARLKYPLVISSVSLAVIVVAFISIRYMDQPPLYNYVFFLDVAFSLMLVIVWLCYDAVRLLRASQSVLSSLLARNAEYMRGLSRAEKLQVLKMAIAMKELQCPMGEFTAFLNTLFFFFPWLLHSGFQFDFVSTLISFDCLVTSLRTASCIHCPTVTTNSHRKS